MLEFVNRVYQPVNKNNLKDLSYTKMNISTKDIFGAIMKYSEEFVTVNSFTSWCSTNKLDFMSVEPARRVLKMDADSQKIRLRALNILDNNCHGNKKRINIGNKGIILINYLSWMI